MAAGLRPALRAVARALPLGLAPLDMLLRFSQRSTAALAHLSFVRDWQLEARGRPQFFKHEVNLGLWPFEPSRWSFAARGVYARQNMFRGCKVLDLCCGDGSVSYLFFSDIAGCIDAVDVDESALAYARRFHAAPVISYRHVDIVNEPLPARDYDFVVWNAAICYFSESDIAAILAKIVTSGSPRLRLNGMLPRANGWVDHKTEFADAGSVEGLLRRFFSDVRVREVVEGNSTTFYFDATAPLAGASS